MNTLTAGRGNTEELSAAGVAGGPVAGTEEPCRESDADFQLRDKPRRTQGVGRDESTQGDHELG